jgi:hypothetical protein
MIAAKMALTFLVLWALVWGTMASFHAWICEKPFRMVIAICMFVFMASGTVFSIIAMIWTML